MTRRPDRHPVQYSVCIINATINTHKRCTPVGIACQQKKHGSASLSTPAPVVFCANTRHAAQCGHRTTPPMSPVGHATGIIAFCVCFRVCVCAKASMLHATHTHTRQHTSRRPASSTTPTGGCFCFAFNQPVRCGRTLEKPHSYIYIPS